MAVRETTGCVALCDIKAFSEKPSKVQVHNVTELSAWLKAELRKRKWRTQPYLNSTGDGFLLAIDESPFKDSKRPQSPVEWALLTCRRLLRKSMGYTAPSKTRAEHAKLQLRFALTLEKYTTGVSSFGATHAVGLAPNLAARIIGVAGPRHVVVSERLRDDLAEAAHGAGGKDLKFKRFWPHDVGLEVVVKHNRRAVVYMFKGDGDKTVNRTLPARIEYYRMLDRRILEELSRICSGVVSALGRASRPRVSVFVPDADRRRLQVTRYRVRHDGKDVLASRTAYAIVPKRRAQGPVGLAYAHGKPVVVAGLPADEPADNYFKRLCAARTDEGMPLNLFEADLRRDGCWRRKAQAYVCVPVRLGSSDPGAALCVDLRSPLGNRTKAWRQRFARDLEEHCADSLAALLAARAVSG